MEKATDLGFLRFIRKLVPRIAPFLCLLDLYAKAVEPMKTDKVNKKRVLSPSFLKIDNI